MFVRLVAHCVENPECGCLYVWWRIVLRIPSVGVCTSGGALCCESRVWVFVRLVAHCVANPECGCLYVWWRILLRIPSVGVCTSSGCDGRARYSEP